MIKGIVVINGEQFFTAQWVMEQMNAQNDRIDRANRLAAVSICTAILAAILAAVL